MQIIAVVGSMGSGKTLLMTYLAFQDFKDGRNVFSNYGLKFKFEPFNRKFLENYSNDGSGLMDCTVCADEFHIWFDSRNSMSKSSKMISYMINQCRKRSVDFMFTTQTIEQVDIRLRRAISLIAYPKLYQVDKKRFTLKVKYVYPSGVSRVVLYKDIQEIFKLYDTNEIIDFE